MTAGRAGSSLRMYLSDSGNGQPLTSTGRRAQVSPTHTPPHPIPSHPTPTLTWYRRMTCSCPNLLVHERIVATIWRVCRIRCIGA
jgi:hypothetical protein